MKKKILSIAAAAFILTSSVPANLNSAKAVFEPYYVTDENNTVCTARFENLSSGNIVFFPEAMYESEEKYPVVVWANGSGCPPIMYYELLSQISAGGYIVVTNTDLFCGDGVSQSASVDFIINENSDEESIFYNKIDTSHIGAAGHSQGGKSSVNASVLDTRIDCIFSIAGNTSQSEAALIDVPTFFAAGSNDLLVYPSLWVKPAYKKCSAPAVYANLKNGTHLKCCISPSVYSEYALKWFDAFLKEDDEAKKVFRDGGKLSKDNNWKDYASKNI